MNLPPDPDPPKGDAALPDPDQSDAAATPAEPLGRDLLNWAQTAIHERAARRHFLPEALIREPAWDILLDLFVADALGRAINTTSACIASGVPTATALRWIDALQEAGLLRRSHDPVDRRVTLVALTDTGRDRMTAYIRRIR